MFYANVYNRRFTGRSANRVQQKIEHFENTVWKNRRLSSWTIWEII